VSPGPPLALSPWMLTCYTPAIFQTLPSLASLSCSLSSGSALTTSSHSPPHSVLSPQLPGGVSGALWFFVPSVHPPTASDVVLPPVVPPTRLLSASPALQSSTPPSPLLVGCSAPALHQRLVLPTALSLSLFSRTPTTASMVTTPTPMSLGEIDPCMCLSPLIQDVPSQSHHFAGGPLTWSLDFLAECMAPLFTHCLNQNPVS
jgi:hypothetical protein